MKRYFIIFLLFVFYLQGISLSEEMTVKCLGHWGGACSDLAFYQNHVCLAEGPSLTVVDITDPLNPVPVSKTLLKGIISHIVVINNLAYVTHYEKNGIQIIDLTNPIEPQLLGYYTFDDFPRYIHDLQMENGYAYLLVSGSDSGIKVMDLRDPNNPIWLGTMATHINGFFIENGLFYYAVNSSYASFHIAEVRFPASGAPYLLPKGSCYPMNKPFNVIVDKGKAFLTNIEGCMKIVNVSDPANPSVLGGYQDPEERYITRITAKDNLAFFYSDDSLLIFDVSNPMSPTLKSENLNMGSIKTCQARGQYLYMSDFQEGLKILDISDPGQVYSASRYSFSGRVFGVSSFANMAYLVDGFTGFRILKINQPEEIVPIYLDETDGIYYRLFNKEGFVYIADIENGLKIFDVRPHKPPSLAGEIKVAEQTRGVFVQDQLAYLAHGEYGFSIVDVTNPEAPALKGFCETPGWAQRVCVSGSYAYVADFQGGLQIINCSDREHPAIEKSYRPLDHSITSVCYYKDLVYCVGSHGLFIVDPKDPSNPQLTGNYHLILDGNPSRYHLGLSVIADMAFLATRSDGIDVLDVSDPTSPSLKMNIPLSGSSFDMDIHINRGVAYIANGLGGLYILGFSSIPNIYYIKDQILGRNEPGETINPYWDVNKDFNLDISDITTIVNPATDPVSEP